MTRITASERSNVLYLAGEIPEPGYHYFRVTADADGPRGPQGRVTMGGWKGYNFFPRIPSGYEGSLAVSPGSARSDSREKLNHHTYTLRVRVWKKDGVEFYPAREITATPGQDKLVAGR